MIGSKLQNAAALAGRILLSIIFILGAIGDLTHWNQSAGMLRGQLAPVQSAATSQRFSVGVGFETGVTC